MLECFSTNATVAKARAKYGKRLKSSDYRELLHKSTVSEVADYLKRNTHYSEVLAVIDTNTIHRGFLEDLVRRENFNNYIKLCHFQSLNKIPFYNYRIIQQEIIELVSFILHINAQNTEEYIKTIPNYIIGLTSFDILELANCRKYDDMLNVIKKTRYYGILKEEKLDENGLYDCTAIEVKLRTDFLQWMKLQISKSFNKKISSELNTIISRQTVLINISNGFRMKAFNNAGEEIIEKHMLSYTKNYKWQKQLYSSSDTDEYINRLKKTYFGKMMLLFDETMEESFIDSNIHRLRYNFAREKLRETTNAAVSLYCILFIFDVEIENVINIIEGIRYKAPMAYIEKLLIM